MLGRASPRFIGAGDLTLHQRMFCPETPRSALTELVIVRFEHGERGLRHPSCVIGRSAGLGLESYELPLHACA
jgi:hypothetical protein